MGELLVAFAQQADQLRLEDGLQEIVGIVLVEDEEIILPGAGGATPVQGHQPWGAEGWCQPSLEGSWDPHWAWIHPEEIWRAI